MFRAQVWESAFPAAVSRTHSHQSVDVESRVDETCLNFWNSGSLVSCGVPSYPHEYFPYAARTGSLSRSFNGL